MAAGRRVVQVPILDKRRQVPLHRQIEDWIRDLVSRPDYQAGRLLPDEVTLARELKVSRNTLRSAMSRLVFAGILERTPKVGTRVARRGLDHRLDEWHSFRAEMAGKGITVSDFSIDLRRQRTAGEVAAALGVEVGTTAWRLRRVRGWEGQAMLVADSWLHPRLRLTGSEDFTRPLYAVLRLAGGAPPVRSREQIAAVSADEELACLLGMPRAAPVLVRRRTVLDRKGRAIEYNLNWYRADKYILTLDLAVGRSVD